MRSLDGIIIVLDAFVSYLRENNEYDSSYPSLIKNFAFLVGDSNYYEKVYHGLRYKELTEYFDYSPESLALNMVNLALLMETVHRGYSNRFNKQYCDYLVSRIESVFAASPINIGYTFTGKTIIKNGAEELDDSLITENLEWLNRFPNIRNQFESALKYYLGKQYPDAIANAYSALEGLIKTILETEKRLDNKVTRTKIIEALQLDKQWGQLLYLYCDIAHEFSSRHGKRETGEPSPANIEELTEFYVYMTGTFIRAISRIIVKRDRDVVK
jgi:hypothetical protein